MTLPWVMPGKMLKDLLGSPPSELALVQLGVWGSFIGLTLLALWRLPLAYGLTGLLLLLPSYLASWSLSLSRHVLLGVPAFVALAIVANRQWVRWLIVSTTLLLLGVLTLLFVNGFWIA